MSRLVRLLRLQYSSPLSTIELLHRGIPVAVLSRMQGWYLFRYLEAFKDSQLQPLPGLPDLDEIYEAPDLFPCFEARIPDIQRHEIQEWLRRHGLPENDKLALLAALGRRKATDQYDIRYKSE